MLRLNPEAIAVLDELLTDMEPARWAEEIEELLDDYSRYLLADEHFTGHREAAESLEYLRSLRDAFRRLAEIDKGQAA